MCIVFVYCVINCRPSCLFAVCLQFAAIEKVAEGEDEVVMTKKPQKTPIWLIAKQQFWGTTTHVEISATHDKCTAFTANRSMQIGTQPVFWALIFCFFLLAVKDCLSFVSLWHNRDNLERNRHDTTTHRTYQDIQGIFFSFSHCSSFTWESQYLHWRKPRWKLWMEKAWLEWGREIWLSCASLMLGAWELAALLDDTRNQRRKKLTAAVDLKRKKLGGGSRRHGRTQTTSGHKQALSVKCHLQ